MSIKLSGNALHQKRNFSDFNLNNFQITYLFWSSHIFHGDFIVYFEVSREIAMTIGS